MTNYINEIKNVKDNKIKNNNNVHEIFLMSFWVYLFNVDDIDDALPRMMALKLCKKLQEIWWGSLVALKMRRSISFKREHPADPTIPDVLKVIGTNSKFATS